MKKMLFFLFLLSSLFANELYVVNSISQTLSRINLDTGTVDNSFALLGQTPGNAANKIAIWQNFALVVITYENAVQKIDLTGTSPTSYIFLEDSASPHDVAVYENFAYVTGNETNKVYKIDLLTNSVISSLQVGQSPQGLTINAPYLFVANTGFNYSNFTYEQGSVSKINLNDFSLVSTINTDTNPTVLEVVNGFLHAACTGDYATIFGKVNVIEPNSDEIAHAFETGGSPSNIASFNNEKVFLGNGWPAGVFAYDALSYELEITPEDGIFSGGNAVYVFQDRLVTLDALDYQQNSLVRIYSLIDYSLVAQYTVGIGATDVIYFGTESDAGDTALPASAIQLMNYPNPFNPSTTIQFSSEHLKQNEQITLDIFNLKGQRIKQFKMKNEKCKMNKVVWDGRDEKDNAVASGIYFFRLSVAGKQIAVRKGMLLK
jgi:YVTN family beta-propeller protein